MLLIFFLLLPKVKLLSSVSFRLMAMDFVGVSFNVSLFMSHKILNIYYPKGVTKDQGVFNFLTVTLQEHIYFPTMAIQIYIVILLLFLQSDSDILQWRDGVHVQSPWISVELYNFFFFFLLLDCNRSDTTLLCDFGGWSIESGAAILPWLPLELSHQLVRKPLSHG